MFSRRASSVGRLNRRGIGSASSWRPTQLSGCVLWLRADMGITKDGSDRVSAWADQSGNGNHFTQGTGARQPKWLATGGKSGGPAVQFRFASNAECMDSAAGFVVAQPFTVVTLMYKRAVATAGDRIFDGLAAVNQAIIYSGATTDIRQYAGADVNSSVVYTAATWFRMQALFNGASSVLRVNTTETAGNPGAGSWTAGARVGNNGGGAPTTALDGYIQHYLVYSRALSAIERGQLDAWMAAQ